MWHSSKNAASSSAGTLLTNSFIFVCVFILSLEVFCPQYIVNQKVAFLL